LFFQVRLHRNDRGGKGGDFLVLDRNPLEEIRNMRGNARGYLRGAELDRAALRARWAQ